MFKKYLLGFIIFMTITHANDKNWFMELGWKISAPTTSGYYQAFDTDDYMKLNFDWEGTHDELYVEAGRLFEIENTDALFSVSAGTTFIILDSSYKYDVFFGKISLLYPSELFNTKVKVGPSVKFLLPYNSYFYDEEFVEDAYRVEYDTNSAFAFGIESVWGSGDWKMVTGLEYLTSAKYKGVYRHDSGHAQSEIDLDGVYFNIGLRYSF